MWNRARGLYEKMAVRKRGAKKAYFDSQMLPRLGFLVGFFLCHSLGANPQKYAAIVIDARDGAVLHEESAQKKRYPASLTKMMTLYLLFEALESKKVKLGTRMKISKKAARQPPGKLGLKAGKKINVKDALLGVMTKSANDAAVVIAEHLAGSEKTFALRMTKKARVLGMKKTVFRNSHGLPNKNQYTTAEDMAILGRALLQRFPAYYRYFRTQAFWYQGRKFKNHNRLLGKIKGVDGIKTGYINASGYNLAASALREGHRLVAVVMGGHSSRARDRRMAQLLEVTFKSVLRRRRLFLAALSPPEKPFHLKRSPWMMAQGPSIIPLPLPDRKQPDLLPLPGVTLLSAPISPEPLAPESYHLAAAVPPTDPIGTHIRALEDPIGEKIRRLEALAFLPRHQPYWSVQVGAFSRAKEAHALAIQQLARLSPSYDATVSVTLSKQRRRNLYRARLSGLTKEEAHTICLELKAQGQRCLPISPHRDPRIVSAENIAK